MNKKMMKIEQRLIKLNDELVLAQQAVLDKMNKDIANYGVPLGNSVLRRKVADKEEAIKMLKDKLYVERKTVKERKFKLSNKEQRVLDAVRNNGVINNTRTSTGNRCDNRFNGSYNSRRIAWRLHNTKVD
jgi:capsular polysaccharide biosynthesis protein